MARNGIVTLTNIRCYGSSTQSRSSRGGGLTGAETPTASLKGLRVYLAESDGRPVEIQPPLVGIDHCFSFPLRYFETHGLLPDWPRFLDAPAPPAADEDNADRVNDQAAMTRALPRPESPKSEAHSSFFQRYPCNSLHTLPPATRIMVVKSLHREGTFSCTSNHRSNLRVGRPNGTLA
jgi:hypothetical protein